MPYVPSLKTDGKSQDRAIIDAALEPLVADVAGKITNNLSLIREYKKAFAGTAFTLANKLGIEDSAAWASEEEAGLGRALYEVSASYDYEGAYLGELNYAITRFIQRVPGVKVERGDWKQELRYWMYASTVEALIVMPNLVVGWESGMGGVFEDIKDEYKRRVNTAYEAEQILKSGDCYDTPYYTRLVRVMDDMGKLVGHMEIMLKRSEETLHVDRLPGRLVLSLEGGKKI